MAIFKKDLLARYILAVLAFGLFSLSFVTSSHLAPNGQRQLITLDHQVRRVLLRAERINLKNSAASDEEGNLVNPPREFSEMPQSLKIVVTYYNILAASQIHFEPESSVLESSPVLNL